MESLAMQYSPIIYIHSEERYFPCSINWLLNYSTLIDFNDNTRISKPTHKDIFEIAKKYNFERRGDGDVVLSFPESVYKGQQPISDVPIYCIMKELNGKVYLTYFVVFAFNGNYEIAGLVGLGSHPGDIEHVTLEFENNKLLRMFYGAHGSTDGRWINASDIEYDNGHPVCYMAYSGHGLYPKCGQVFRFGGFANDYLDRGFKWSPHVDFVYLKDHEKFNVDTMGWVMFNSRFGGNDYEPNTEGIMSLLDKDWFKNIDNLDANYYKPPPIIDEKWDFHMKVALRFLIIAILYTAILLVRIFVRKYLRIVPENGTRIIYKGIEHIVNVGIIVALYYGYMYWGKKLLLKYVPS